MTDEISPGADTTQPLDTTPAILAATVLGVGWLRPAPGTWGSLAGLPLAWVVMQIPGGGGVPAAVFQAIAAAAIFLVGIPICTAAARQMGKKDPGEIVYDEWAAMPFVFLLVPLGSVWIWLAGFALFRLFDIVKPPPIKRFERLPEGLGVMADDLVAACYANIALQILVRVGPLSPV